MGVRLFVDSSAFIALADTTDQDHKAAEKFLRSCSPETEFHTSNEIISETITRLRKTAGHHAALRWAQETFRSRQTFRHYIDETVEREAMSVFEKYRDHLLSFADCTTVVLAKQLHIDRIFTFDSDFQRIGFTWVPGLET